MKIVHGIEHITLTSTIGIVNKARKCNWVCGVSLDCFLEHAKFQHGQVFQGANDFPDNDSFMIYATDKNVTDHTDICSEARAANKKERVKRNKAEWLSRKKDSKRAAKRYMEELKANLTP